MYTGTCTYNGIVSRSKGETLDLRGRRASNYWNYWARTKTCPCQEMEAVYAARHVDTALVLSR